MSQDPLDTVDDLDLGTGGGVQRRPRVPHGTNMNVETNFVDSHGASIIGFGIIRLLNFDLVARFKQIKRIEERTSVSDRALRPTGKVRARLRRLLDTTEPR